MCCPSRSGTAGFSDRPNIPSSKTASNVCLILPQPLYEIAFSIDSTDFFNLPEEVMERLVAGFGERPCLRLEERLEYGGAIDWSIADTGGKNVGIH
jgi:hypothetical protein